MMTTTKRGVLTTIVIFVLALVTLGSCALAADTIGGGTVTLHTDKGQYPADAAGSVNVTAGNVTEVNLTTNAKTTSWVGLYGNVSGIIRLGDSSSNTLYKWSAVGKYVYASTASSINWLTISPATVPQVITQYPFLTNGSDNYTITFASTGSIDSDVIGSVLSIPRAMTYNSTGNGVWQTLSLFDGTNVLFAGVVNSTGQNAYDGETVNYQMIIPENGLYQNTAPTEYFLWVELT